MGRVVQLSRISFFLLLLSLASFSYAWSPSLPDDPPIQNPVNPTSNAPDKFEVRALNTFDRDGVVVLRWNASNINGKRAQQYKVVILGWAYPGLNQPTPSDPHFAMNPVLVEDNGKDEIVLFLDLVQLLGPDMEGDLGNYRNLLRDMVFNNKKTTLYFAVAASNTEDSAALPEFQPRLGPDGRQLVGRDGRFLINEVKPFSYVGSKFAGPIPAQIQLAAAPDKLRLVLQEKQAQPNGGFVFVDKQQVDEPVPVSIGFSNREGEPAEEGGNVFDLNNFFDRKTEEFIDFDVYDDGDGVLDLRWEIAEGSRAGEVPNFSLYNLQVSKWPVFTFENDDLALVNRYFAPEENVSFIYEPQDFPQPDLSNANGYLDHFLDFAAKVLSRPFFSKNLAISGFDTDLEGNNTAIFRSNDEFGVVDQISGGRPSIFYLRIAAMGRENTALQNGVVRGIEITDERIGSFSDPIAVRIFKNERLPALTFTDTPESLDGQRAQADRLIPQGRVPLVWEILEGNGDPNAAENVQNFPIYEVIASQNPNIVNQQRSLLLEDPEDETFVRHFVLASDLGQGTAQSPHYEADMRNAQTGEVLPGTYFVWARIIRNGPDVIPSLWSEPTLVNMPNITIPDPPVLTRPSGQEDQEIVPLNWHIEEPGDPLSDKFIDENSADYLTHYQVLVYRKEDLESAEPTVARGFRNALLRKVLGTVEAQSSVLSPVDGQGFLQFEDANNNTVNDWEETLNTGGRAFGVYRILPEEIRSDLEDALFEVPLNMSFDVSVGEDGSLDFAGTPRSIPTDDYVFFLRSFNVRGQASPLSNPGSVLIDTSPQTAEQPQPQQAPVVQQEQVSTDLSEPVELPNWRA